MLQPAPRTGRGVPCWWPRGGPIIVASDNSVIASWVTQDPMIILVHEGVGVRGSPSTVASLMMETSP